jgi:hypothetical protein
MPEPSPTGRELAEFTELVQPEPVHTNLLSQADRHHLVYLPAVRP